MAYISNEQIQRVKDAVKREFPESRFTFRKSGGNIALTITLRKSPVFPEAVSRRINHYYIGTEDWMNDTQKDFMTRLICVVRSAARWFDNSDPQIDYFHTAFYEHYQVEVK